MYKRRKFVFTQPFVASDALTASALSKLDVSPWHLTREQLLNIRHLATERLHHGLLGEIPKAIPEKSVEAWLADWKANLPDCTDWKPLSTRMVLKRRPRFRYQQKSHNFHILRAGDDNGVSIWHTSAFQRTEAKKANHMDVYAADFRGQYREKTNQLRRFVSKITQHRHLPMYTETGRPTDRHVKCRPTFPSAAYRPLEIPSPLTEAGRRPADKIALFYDES